MAAEAVEITRATEQRLPAKVKIVDLEMPFGSMVLFMVKWVIAAIPAMIILAILLTFAATFLAGLFTALLM